MQAVEGVAESRKQNVGDLQPNWTVNLLNAPSLKHVRFEKIRFEYWIIADSELRKRPAENENFVKRNGTNRYSSGGKRKFDRGSEQQKLGRCRP